MKVARDNLGQFSPSGLRGRSWLFAVALDVVLVFLIANCAKNPFSTRDAEQPTTTGGTFVTPVDPETVLDNLQSAYTERNIANFAQSLSPNFVFFYDFALIGAPDTARSWSNSEELRLTRNLFDGVESFSLILSPIQGTPDEENDSTAVLYRSYEMIAIIESGQQGTAQDTLRFQGESEYRTIRDDLGLWSLMDWIDRHSGEGIESWADLKIRFK